ncbi:MAG: spore coat protein U domain-containing protein, partial [bacterium]
LYLDPDRITRIWGDGTGSTFVFEAPGDGSDHHHGLPPQADCHAHVSPKFVRKYHLRVQGEKHEHPPGEYRHHDFVTTLTIYGRISANQTDLTPGAYSDSITVTINF